MTQRLILVTGGASGIGKACVERFAADGDHVISVDLQHETTSVSPQVFQEVFDLTQLDEIVSWVSSLVERYGLPDVIVNSAGISRMNFLIDSPVDEWEAIFKLNVFAIAQLSRAFANAWLGIGSPGRIINIASQAGKNGYRGLGAYVASKHAVIGLTKTAAVELAPHNILVNAVCPGIVETPMKHRERIDGGVLRGLTADEILAEDISQVPLGRTAQPSDVANVVHFLASQAADYMTGQAINVTGGMTMH